jgi:hypothetical protein
MLSCLIVKLHKNAVLKEKRLRFFENFEKNTMGSKNQMKLFGFSLIISIKILRNLIKTFENKRTQIRAKNTNFETYFLTSRSYRKSCLCVEIYHYVTRIESD